MDDLIKIFQKYGMYIDNGMRDEFLRDCEKAGITVSGGAVTEDGQWFYPVY